MNFQVRACIQSVHHQHTDMISDGHASTDDVTVKVETSLHQAFSQVVDVMNLFFIHVRHMMTLVHFDLVQFSLAISPCNVTFSVFWLSQDSVATLIRSDGWSSHCHMCRSFLNLSVKSALKSVDFWQSYKQKQVGSFLWPTVYVHFATGAVQILTWRWWYDDDDVPNRSIYELFALNSVDYSALFRQMATAVNFITSRVLEL